ncbi:hypothetical protein [Alkalibacterium kapii]|uniref:Uncharacterized protein n=1 Tax=Alkalibacterium kapii TaxID=426704 RepID=A0A511AVT3_9LACT|nr:hypothetical protein [Alkalibacterium kapii]GEK91443.1 hypothetical protein AKA01nite_10650 [Alkalibacterium kapii]
MSSKYTDFFEMKKSSERNQKNKKKKQVSFDSSYSLPENIKSREIVEKGFKDYLSNQDNKRSKGYISPPFEASKVPSPIYGYHKPKKDTRPIVDYKQLKDEMKKDRRDLILFEAFITEELKSDWLGKIKNQEDFAEKKQNSRKQLKAKRIHGLNRTLEDIIEEEKGGKNQKRNHVPGFFNNNENLYEP